MTPLDVSRASLQAYVNKDRAAIEKLVASTFRFTSPIDNQLDRATYFERCWPNSESMMSVKVEQALESHDTVFLIYEIETGSKRFRNCEMHTVREGQLVSVEVYFGWDLPHPAPAGGFVDRSAGD